MWSDAWEAVARISSMLSLSRGSEDMRSTRPVFK